MLNSFPAQRDIDIEMMLESFLMCVDEYSPEAVEEAVARYCKGEVVGHDARFAPSTAQFTQQVKERQSYIDFRKIKRAPVERQIEKPSPRVKPEAMQALSDALAGKRTIESVQMEFIEQKGQGA